MNEILAGGYGALLALLCAVAPLRAQTPDSVRAGTPTREFYTRVVPAPPVVDTVLVPIALRSGADTAVSGDTTRIAFWHEGIARTQDSAKVVVKAPPLVLGKPFGPAALYTAPSTAPFTYAAGESAEPRWIISKIDKARATNTKVMLSFPCGAHSLANPGNCLAWFGDTLRFSQFRWDSLIGLYKDPLIQAAVQKGYAEGVIVGLNVMDEPWVYGGNDGSGSFVGNTWGVAGTITKAKADALCASVKAVFPGVPVGLSDFREWEPTKDLKVCDFGLTQYVTRFGDVTTWREGELARAKRGGYPLVFSFNIVNGGTQDQDALRKTAGWVWDCAKEGGAKGSNSPNCQATPTQVVAYVQALGDAGCGGLMMWRSYPERFGTPAYGQAFATALAIQAKRVQRPCKPRS